MNNIDVVSVKKTKTNQKKRKLDHVNMFYINRMSTRLLRIHFYKTKRYLLAITEENRALD